MESRSDGKSHRNRELQTTRARGCGDAVGATVIQLRQHGDFSETAKRLLEVLPVVFARIATQCKVTRWGKELRNWRYKAFGPTELTLR